MPGEAASTTSAEGGRDFYAVLGVVRDAGRDEIRRAYRALALECHPDRNQGSPEAEDRFKELAEAFRTLSDPERRARYDRVGRVRGFASEETGPDLAQALEVFVDQFRAFVRDELGPADGGGVDPGSVGRITLPVTLAEVVTGATREIPLPCARCAGSGTGPLPDGGSGTCVVCVGTGTAPSGERLLFEIPPGVETGALLAATPADPGPPLRGRPVVAEVVVEEDARFRRAGADLVVELVIDEAAARAVSVGEPWEIATPTGTVPVEAPPAALAAGVLRVSGMGLPGGADGARGDLIVKLAPSTTSRASGTRPQGSAGEGESGTGRAGALAADRSEAAEALTRAMRRVEGRFTRFLDRERRPPTRPYGLHLARVQREIADASRREIDGLVRLEAGVKAAIERLDGTRLPVPFRSSHDASLAAEGAGETRDGLVAFLVLLALSAGLGLLNVLALGGAFALLVPDPEAVRLPLLFRTEALLPLLVTAGAFGSGLLAQALGGDAERGPRGGARAPDAPAAPPLLAKAGPYGLAVAAVTIEALVFASLAEVVNLPALLGLDADTLLAVLATVVVPLAGLAIPLGLMSLGAGLWFNARRMLRATARGSLGRRLALHLERLRSLPHDAREVEDHIAQVGDALDRLRERVADTVDRARSIGTSEAPAALAEAASRARTSPPPRSSEEILGGVALGSGGFLLFTTVLLLLHGRLSAGLIGLGDPVALEVAAVAGTLAFPLLAYLVRDALLGPSQTAALVPGLPHERVRRVVGALAGALLVLGILGAGWITLPGAPGSTMVVRLVWAVLPAIGATLLAFNLDGWIVSAGKAVWLIALGGAWVGLVAGRVLARVADALARRWTAAAAAHPRAPA